MDGFNLPFKSSPVPGSKLKSFFLSCAHSLFLRSLFSFYTKVHNLFGNILSRIQWERNFYPFPIPNSFLSLTVTTKGYRINTTMLWEKKNLLLSWLCWKLEDLGLCVIVHRTVPFPLLSLYIVFRDYIVSLHEYGQLAFTNICLSTFSF